MPQRLILGFAIGFLIFIAINLLSAHLNSDCSLLTVFERDTSADDIARASWALSFMSGLDLTMALNSTYLFY
jgi:hypothetical protein